MAQTTTTSATNAILAKYIEAQIREALQATLIMPQLVRQADLRGKGSLTWAVNQWPKLTAAGVAETADIAASEVTLGQATITVGEVGISVESTDLSSEAGGPTPEEYAARGAMAIRQKMDSDLCGLFTGLSASVGSTGTEFTLDTLIDGLTKLEMADVQGQKFIVLHPKQAGVLRKLIAGASGSQASYYVTGAVDPSLKAIPGFVCDFLGAPVYMTSWVPKINTNADFCGAIFTPEAFGMATLRDVRVEPQRDASKRATEMVVTSAYGVGELDDTCGVRLISKVA